MISPNLGLIRFVSANSQIPVIQHFKGVCHCYIDEFADEAKALAIVENGKTQRTSVCNSLETVLVHASVAASVLPKIAVMFAKHDVKVHACAESLPYFGALADASLADVLQEKQSAFHQRAYLRHRLLLYY